MTTKTKNLTGVLFTFISLTLTSCAIDGDEVLPPKTETKNESIAPNEYVERALDIKYPDAKDVVWSQNGSYYVADFNEYANRINAWFQGNGEWMLSKTAVSTNDVKQIIETPKTKGLVQGDYQILETSLLERKDLGNVYVIESSSASGLYNTYYTESGDLIRNKSTYSSYVDKPVEIPEHIDEFIDDHYGLRTTIYDVWQDQLGYKAGITENNVYKVVALDTAYDWIATIWDVNEREVPSAVMDGFHHSSYGNSKIESIKQKENDTEVSYLFYFDAADKHRIATVSEWGTLRSVLSY